MGGARERVKSATEKFGRAWIFSPATFFYSATAAQLEPESNHTSMVSVPLRH